MDTTIDQQVAMDKALVPTAQRLKIGRSNFRLLSDIKSKESTLQLVYDVLHICPFFKAFLVTTDVPEIYMQEFWATTTIHYHSIRFKMDNKKHIVNLESFRDILHICSKVHGQSFAEPPFEEEILAFIYFLGHSAAIRMLIDVNINKLYQPWRSFAAIINKCLTGKSSGYDSLRLSQAQILWGLYHKRNVDYAYLMWEDFVYQVEHKNQKKSNEMYYPRFTKAIIHHFISKDPSISRRNKVNWHYVRDDHMFSTIKLVSRHQNTQQFGALLPIELTNDEIRNSKPYKEYYTITTREAAPKPKVSVRRTRSSSDTSITPPTAAASPRLTASGKQTTKASKAKSLSAHSEVAMTEAQQLKLVTKRSMQQTHISQASSSGADEGTGSKPRVPDVPTNELEEELSWNSTDDEGDDNEEKDDDGDEEDEGDDGEEGNDDDQEYDDEYAEETRDEESFDPIPKTSENSEDEGDGKEDQGLNIGEKKDMLKRKRKINSIETSTLIREGEFKQILKLKTLILRSLETNFSEAMQTNQFAGAVSAILEIVQRFMDQRMNEAVKVAIQIQSDRLREEAHRENDEFLKTVDENMKNIIKE
nr:hypothetical protein [Tanacetum cinerariifolium]